MREAFAINHFSRICHSLVSGLRSDPHELARAEPSFADHPWCRSAGFVDVGPVWLDPKPSVFKGNRFFRWSCFRSMVLITLTISPDFAKSSAALKRTSGRRSTNTTVFRRLPCMVPVVKPMTIFSPSRAWQARPLLPARAWRHPRFPHPASAYAGGKTRPRRSGRGAIALRIVRTILPAARRLATDKPSAAAAAISATCTSPPTAEEIARRGRPAPFAPRAGKSPPQSAKDSLCAPWRNGIECHAEPFQPQRTMSSFPASKR